MNDFVLAPGAPWVATVLLLSARLAALFLMTPLLYAVPVPGTVRALFVVGLAAAISLPFAAAPVSLPHSLGDLLAGFLSELALGATMGLGILMAFAGFDFAGRLLDVQVGFGIAQVFDPVTRRQVPVISSVFSSLALLVFFLVDGHHALLRGVALSLDRFPVGQPWSVAGSAEPIVRQAAGLFTLGFALAAPVVLSLLLLEFALGVVSRNLPQVNMLALGIPVKIVAGLLALSVWAGGMGGVMLRVYADIYRTWAGLFEAAPARGPR
ncbi:flagellar biosynthetic protein FliR [Ramlibacter humi]|uniref:flagellar biosynthetic protein FliR n=1 Tax=Ramlibacter humi TaxID=2530451 RepID=UPI001EF013C5|nr:flagellar biosynthetic protein FliR [Ramlibacter humi]